jgi:protein gp37
MATTSRIEWTEMTWNPVTGCDKVSAGCKYCYAEVMARRLLAMGQPRYANGFKVTLQEDLVELPLTWHQPRTVFVNSMSDLFHDEIPESFIQRVFATMVRAERHTFQVLTKRAGRLAELAPRLPWPSNVWMGVSVENRAQVQRIKHLQQVNAAVRFLSVEPLLEAIPEIPLDGIGWCIVGGESGVRARPIDQSWVTDIRDQCARSGVPFFFKQWGGRNKKASGRLLEGREYNEMPEITAVAAR